MTAAARRFLASLYVPPAAAAVGASVCAALVLVPLYVERAAGRPIDVSWFCTINLVIVYALQVAPLFVYGFFAAVRRTTYPPAEPRVRFVCFVPAHNEQRVISVSAGSLLAQDYPRHLYDVWVVSDGSTDRTEAIARSLGAKVLCTPTGGVGKARALAFAFAQTLRESEDNRYVCVVDADNRVDAHFLREMNNAICAGGFRCLQAFQDVLNGPVNWITKALWITTLSSSLLYNQGRSEGIGNALVSGTGWCCQVGLVRRYWPRIQTQTEDIELNGLLLLHEGIGVRAIAAARVYDEKPTTLWVAIRQRQRWMTGHMRTAALLFWPCLREGIRRRDVRLVELAAYYLLPFVMNLGNIQVLLSAGFQVGLLTVRGPVASPVVQWGVTALTLLYLFGYQVAGFALETGLWGRAPLYSIAAAAFGFIAWTPALVCACFTFSRTDWMFHTPHGGDPERAPRGAGYPDRAPAAAWHGRLVPAPALRVTAAVVALLALLPVAGLGSEVSAGDASAKIASSGAVQGAGATEGAAGAKEAPTVAEASEAILSGRAAYAATLLEPFVAGDVHDLEAEGLFATALYASDQRVQAQWEASLLRRQDPSRRRTAFLVARDLLPAFSNHLSLAGDLVELLTPAGGARGYLWLGRVFQDGGYHDDANAVLGCGAAALDPGDTSWASVALLAALGSDASMAGMPATAVTAYWQAIRLRPRSPWLYAGLARAYVAWGRYEAANATWAMARRLRRGTASPPPARDAAPPHRL